MGLFRTVVTSVAALAAGMVAACDQVPTSRVLYMRPGGVAEFMRWATSQGPLLVEVPTHPFQNDPHLLADAIADAVKSGVRGRVIEVAHEPEAAGDPTYRVRVALSSADDIATARALCLGQAPLADGEAQRLTALMVFCSKGDMEAAITGYIPWPDGPADPQLGKLIAQMSRQMFAEKGGV